MRRILVIVALCLLVALPVRADSDDGAEAYERGDYATALKEWRPLAEQGNAGAQTLLGLIYDNGYGVPQDFVQAHMWWNLTAAQGVDEGRQARDRITEKMTPDQIAEAQRLAREWTEAHQAE